jgi:hypothetical protein
MRLRAHHQQGGVASRWSREHARAAQILNLLGFWCAGETGREWGVQVRHDEGVAIHIGPEPRVGTRADADDAPAGERTGQPLSRENLSNPGADAFRTTEGNKGNMGGRPARVGKAGPTEPTARLGGIFAPDAAEVSGRQSEAIPRLDRGSAPLAAPPTI